MELVDPLHGPCAAQPARGLGRRRCPTRSTACGGWRTPASARSCCSRCSRSSCARRPRATPGSSTSAGRQLRRGAGYFPAVAEEDAGPRRYLSLLERAAAAVDVPVIASLNGVTPEGWTDYARAMQDAGAAAIELNIYYLPGDPRIRGRDVEQRHLDILRRVKAAVTVPVAVKLSPYFSSIGEMALRAGRGRRRRAGAVQPLPAARHRPRDARGRVAGVGPVSSRRTPGCRGRGSRCCADASAHRWPRPPASRSRRRRQVPAGGRRRRDDRPPRCCGTDPSTRPTLLDGLSAWMARKGFETVDELRGLLAAPAAADRPSRRVPAMSPRCAQPTRVPTAPGRRAAPRSQVVAACRCSRQRATVAESAEGATSRGCEGAGRGSRWCCPTRSAARGRCGASRRRAGRRRG